MRMEIGTHCMHATDVEFWHRGILVLVDTASPAQEILDQARYFIRLIMVQHMACVLDERAFDISDCSFALFYFQQRSVAIRPNMTQYVCLISANPKHRTFNVAPTRQHLIDAIQNRVHGPVGGIAGDAVSARSV